jgi:hypothetical protein
MNAIHKVTPHISYQIYVIYRRLWLTKDWGCEGMFSEVELSLHRRVIECRCIEVNKTRTAYRLTYIYSFVRSQAFTAT